MMACFNFIEMRIHCSSAKLNLDEAELLSGNRIKLIFFLRPIIFLYHRAISLGNLLTYF